MAAAASNPRETLSALASAYLGHAVDAREWHTITTGASGRTLARWSRGGQSLIGVYWTPERPDNACFPRAAARLRHYGVRVPKILALQDCGGGCGACLVEDLGDVCLLSLKGEPWPRRKKACLAALSEAARVHAVPDAGGEGLQPPFDAELYRWEQQYFAEHFLVCHLHGEASGFAEKPAMKRMAAFLAARPRVLVHRDFQSQNVMLKEGEAWLIDFQGMRAGLPEYDLASLVFDPYMDLSLEERLELIDEWERTAPAPLDGEVFALCALQRVMQALGAFAKLWYRHGREWYYPWLETGVRSLEQIAQLPGRGPVADDVIACLHDEHILA